MDSDAQLLLDQVLADVRHTAHLTGRRALDPRVIEALRQVPRDLFVPDDVRDRAFLNSPLPIGHGQTISQPFIVALMTDLIEPKPHQVVLEVGTGCGYQTAVLAKLVRQVYSLEVVEELAEDARQRLRRLGYDNVEVRLANGHLGWPEHAPYDAIIATAAAGSMPPALIEQLKPGGTLVIPLGAGYLGQELVVVKKDPNGRVEQKSVLPVSFVPMVQAPDKE